MTLHDAIAHTLRQQPDISLNSLTVAVNTTKGISRNNSTTGGYTRTQVRKAIPYATHKAELPTPPAYHE